MRFGDISSAKINEDIEGNHLGYGYVTYYDPQSAENAIKNALAEIQTAANEVLLGQRD